MRKGITILILILTFFSIPLNVYTDDFDIPPLYFTDEDQKSFLGPFVTIEKTEKRSEFGIRPLFYSVMDNEEDKREFDLIYPLFSYWRHEHLTTIQFLLYLLRYDSEKLPGGFTEKEFTLFPFIFYKDAVDDEEDYFGFFPVYGDLKNKFTKDQIKFVLFPLFMETRYEGEKTTSVLWPFFSRYSGEHEGFRLWPFYGKRTRDRDELDQNFILWPFYVTSEREFYGERIYSKSYFPFYSESELFGVRNKTYLWPLISKTVNEAEDFERWDVPWPFINITRGNKYQTRIFPFYSRGESSGTDEDGFILWPVYKYSTIYLENYIRKEKSFLLFVIKDKQYIPLADNGKKGRTIDFWPLFSYSNIDNRTHFHIFTIFEPFKRTHESLYRNYATFWRLFEWKEYNNDSSKASFLWDIISYEESDKGSSFRIKPIIPVLSVTDYKDGNSIKLMGGLIGYSSMKEADILHLLYYPFKFENGQDNEMIEGKGN